MALVNMRDLLAAAEKGGYAVGSFSVANMECIQGVIRAAEETCAPVILQIAEVRLPYAPLYLIGPMMLAAAARARVPVAVHLDHGKTEACIQEALDIGFTSVMCDGSDLPLEENARLTEHIVSLARKTGAAVEAEVGRIGRNEDGSLCEEQIATVHDCARMKETGIDALAIGIGNAHGIYVETPKLHYEVVEDAHAMHAPALVLHGGSGLTDAQFTRLVKLGMRKINIATDIFHAQAAACTTPDVFKNIALSSEAVSETVKRYIRLFGTEGKAECGV